MTVIVIIVIIVFAFLAIMKIKNNIKTGKCSCGCENCNICEQRVDQ